jgi:hypothetical protein
MMGHRMNFIRRPSSFLLIPVGSPGRDLHFEGLFARLANAQPQHDPGNCERSMRAMIDRSSLRAQR